MEYTDSLRNKCVACYRQFNKMEHLVEHMRTSYHSVHEPICGICNKHCRSFESLREHLIGPLPKAECERIFKDRGCDLCLTILGSQKALRIHRQTCQFSQTNVQGLISRMANCGIYDNLRVDNGGGARVVALACAGTINVCTRVCLVDEHENIIFHGYVKPNFPPTNHRYETSTTIKDAMPLRQFQKKLQEYLCNGEALWKIRPKGGKARILVGHSLDPFLKALELDYPAIMIRDTAIYPPLIKTSKLSNSLKYLTKAYLGYDIQTGKQDPYEEAVATMRLYMRMRSQAHPQKHEEFDTQNRNSFAAWKQHELERMTPNQMLDISRSDYYCWCLDS